MQSTRTISAACIAAILAGNPAGKCAAVSINFDVTASGSPIVSPHLFFYAFPVREEYSSMGVTFAGPAPLDGGAILDTGGGFGVEARSAPNFLSFNRPVLLGNGGFASDPLTLTFTNPISQISIFASGGNSTTFRMQAFDLVGTSVSNVVQTSDAGEYVELSVISITPMTRIVLSEIGGDDSFVFDDLSFTPVPEPAVAGAVLLCGVRMLASRRRK